MKKIELIIRTEKLELLKGILTKYEYSGLTVMSAMGCGHQKGNSEEFEKLGIEINLLPRLYVMTVVWDEDLDEILAEIIAKLSTGTGGCSTPPHRRARKKCPIIHKEATCHDEWQSHRTT